jgi:hypothetical protein
MELKMPVVVSRNVLWEVRKANNHLQIRQEKRAVVFTTAL